MTYDDILSAVVALFRAFETIKQTFVDYMNMIVEASTAMAETSVTTVCDYDSAYERAKAISLGEYEKLSDGSEDTCHKSSGIPIRKLVIPYHSSLRNEVNRYNYIPRTRRNQPYQRRAY